MAREADQWQSDQAGRVIPLDACNQGDAESLRLEAAGAVVGLLKLQVALDLLGVQVAKGDVHGLDAGLFVTVCAVQDAKGC